MKPVAGLIRPGSETSRVGFDTSRTPVRSYVTGIVEPVTTAGTTGACNTRTVASAGPKVSEKLVCARFVPLALAPYVRFTVREDGEASGSPAAPRICSGSNRAQGVAAGVLPEGSCGAFGLVA